MHQLQLDLASVDRIGLDASTEEQLMRPMAEMLLAVMVPDREASDDPES